MLKLEGVTKKFGSLLAVNNISFEVNPGEIVGMIGENGSGKTTTLKMIAGLYQPSDGKITLNDLDISKDGEKTRKIVGYIPDEPAVYDRLTGDEFLHFVSEAFEVPNETASQKIQELKKLFPMEDQTSGYFEDYSRGTRQKFMIMAAFLHEPELVLIDEPIVGLDPASATKATKLFSDYVSEKKKAILLCTHTLSVAEKICHKFIILKKGKILAQGTLEELKEKTNLPHRSLQEVYLKINGENNE